MAPLACRPAVVVAAADSAVAVLDARSGEPAPSAGSVPSGYPWLRPKNPDTALRVWLLDGQAMPLSAPSCPLSLPWALGDTPSGEATAPPGYGNPDIDQD